MRKRYDMVRELDTGDDPAEGRWTLRIIAFMCHRCATMVRNSSGLITVQRIYHEWAWGLKRVVRSGSDALSGCQLVASRHSGCLGEPLVYLPPGRRYSSLTGSLFSLKGYHRSHSLHIASSYFTPSRSKLPNIIRFLWSLVTLLLVKV